MLTLKKIAVTGGIASGKTAVCHILKTHGARVLLSDKIVHRLLEEDPECIKRVVQLLGEAVLTDGKIDRKKVAAVVFSNKEKLRSLENILHPKLFAVIDQEYEKEKKEKTASCFVVEMPLVQEIGKAKDFDTIVFVDCSEETAKSRLKEELSYDQRMARQWTREKKIKHADYVLENSGTMETLKQNTLELLKEICSQ